MGEVVFGLAVVWVHPYQTCVPTLNEAVRKLTLLTTSSKNWAYAFVWLNGDTQHFPLPKEGHLSTMIKGSPSRGSCGHLCQLEVHLLLQSDNWAVYPGRAQQGPGADHNIATRVTSLWHKYAWWPNILASGPFPVHIRQPCTWCLSPPQDFGSNLPNATHPGTSPKSESHVSMTAEVQELLSCAVLDTSSQASGRSTPKRLTSAALGDPSSPTVEDPPKLLDTSSQASPWVAMPDITKPNDQTIPPTKTPGDDAEALPEEVILLQEEINRAIRWLLMTRASLDAHQWKQVSDFEMALYWNMAKTTEAIKEAKAHCGATIQEAEACYTADGRNVWNMSVPSNNHMQKIHSILKQMPWKRGGESASLS